MSNQNQEQSYYNNSTVSPVYINEVKRIQPQKGDAYLACKAAMLDGPCDEPNYVNIDLIVKGSKAIELIESFEDQWPQGYTEDQSQRVKVFAFVRVNSISSKAFLKKDGTAGSILKGKLMEITYLKVNDAVLLSSNGNNTEQSQSDTDSVEAAAPTSDVEQTETVAESVEPAAPVTETAPQAAPVTGNVEQAAQVA